MPLFEARKVNDAMKGSVKYSRNVNIPQYEPKGEKPDLRFLYDAHKYVSLIQEIDASDIPPEEKSFLKLAASRHIVFNYEAIADYYAHSDKKVQELMEHSALVMIDIDDAIANGYVKLSRRLNEIRGDGNLAKRAKDFS